MSRSRSGVLVAFVLANALALAGLAPAEHVHEGDAHHRSVAHRHFSAHHHHGTRLSGTDGPVIWLNDVSVQGTAFRLDVPMPAVVVSISLDQRVTAWVRTLSYDAAPPHGPPRSSLASRAPPAPPSSTI